MEAIYILIPIALLLAALGIAVFFWAVRSGQFDDMEGPAHKILLDDTTGSRVKADTPDIAGDENNDVVAPNSKD